VRHLSTASLSGRIILSPQPKKSTKIQVLSPSLFLTFLILGPGLYQQEKQRVVKGYDETMQNSFKSTVTRFCPTAPGSTAFSAPTYIENPAPTTYSVKKPWVTRDKARDKYNKKTHGDMRVKSKQAVPSIPSRKNAANSYTGKSADRVGPNVYTPQHDLVKKTDLTNDFGSSNVNRRLWEPANFKHNPFTARDNPGPGTYDENETQQVRKKQFNAEGKNSIFLSKVPNCKDAVVVKPR